VRYDVVALLALLTVTLTGIIPQDEAFSGFGHPAVITVAAVLVISQGLMKAGVVDLITRWLSSGSKHHIAQIGMLVSVVTVSSAFMNNIGALALVMPVALRIAYKNGLSPSVFLMPLAFGSLLGGMATLIGTPPNIIISGFRLEESGQAFGVFDFLPVGGAVAAIGVIFIVFLGWRLLPVRKSDSSRADLFRITDYITEVRVPSESNLADKSLRHFHDYIEMYVVVVAIIRGDRRLDAPSSFEFIRPNDILIVEMDSGLLQQFLNVTGFQVEEAHDLPESGEETSIVEAVIRPNSMLINQTARALNMRARFGINLLAISRHGERLTGRLGQIPFEVGDVLLMQGRTDLLARQLPELGCLPISEFDLELDNTRRLLPALLIALGAISVAALGLLLIQVALMGAVVLMILTGIISLKDAYDSIEWPILVLIGAMIPVDTAIEASAVLMAPVEISLGNGLSVTVDPFLIAVAIGASATFMKPIGHQSNTLVMGPAGYRFDDNWRMALPLQIIVATASITLIMVFWPF